VRNREWFQPPPWPSSRYDGAATSPVVSPLSANGVRTRDRSIALCSRGAASNGGTGAAQDGPAEAVSIPRALSAIGVLFLGWTCVCRFAIVRLLGGADGNIELIIAQEYGNSTIAAYVLRRLPGMHVLPALFGPEVGMFSGGARMCRAVCVALVVGCCVFVLPALEGAVDTIGFHFSECGAQGVIDSLTPSSLMPEITAVATDQPTFSSVYLRGDNAAYRHACNGIAAFGLACLAPLWEEVVFRGILMRAIFSRVFPLATNHRRLWILASTFASILVYSIVFAAVHFDESIGIFVAHVSIGCVLGAAYALASYLTTALAAGRSKSEPGFIAAPTMTAIAVPVAIHSVWNLRCSAFEILSAT